MPEQPDLRSTLATVTAQLGGTARIGAVLRRYAMLPVLVFAAVVPLFAAYELYRVHEVSRWQQAPARIVSATWERSTSRPYRSSWRYRLLDLQSGAEIVTGDRRPGDLPITIGTWTSEDAAAARFNARAGETISLRRSPDGSEFYLEDGDSGLMAGVLAICGLFWVWRFRRRAVVL